ncbi:DUF6475 domain-containing protein [Luteibacter yeojuensis]|uniref:DUF6475 domain-containing protein n=1 Tax=Luteibacter yeojuensis TaxID=345309 RepID=A0A7X5TPZ7_9GAMM|nr:DUF6475 domain-containing protein [Luteibacter yeojuensis]NID14987.1 hypothetical protein [Luteibacter yeojuensis]
MQPTDRQPFAELLAEVMTYYRQACVPFVIDVFWNGLRMHEFEDVKRAFSLHARDPDRGQFPPRLADITRLLEGSTQTQGMRAWAKVERAVKSVGAYRSVSFDDPLIHVVLVEMGGWVPLCRCAAEDLPFKAREFERRYAAYRLRRELPAFPPRLIGESEAENNLSGREYQVRPVLIGDTEKAVRVIEQGSDSATLRITDAKYVAGHLLARISHDRREDAA